MLQSSFTADRWARWAEQKGEHYSNVCLCGMVQTEEHIWCHCPPWAHLRAARNMEGLGYTAPLSVPTWLW
eukprot:1693712-Amphidinium_carterae.1